MLPWQPIHKLPWQLIHKSPWQQIHKLPWQQIHKLPWKPKYSGRRKFRRLRNNGRPSTITSSARLSRHNKLPEIITSSPLLLLHRIIAENSPYSSRGKTRVCNSLLRVQGWEEQGRRFGSVHAIGPKVRCQATWWRQRGNDVMRRKRRSGRTGLFCLNINNWF